jgi:hypothetical protein
LKPRSLALHPTDNARLQNLCGALDENLRQIEAAFDVTISRRGQQCRISGDPAQSRLAATALQHFLRAGGRTAVDRRSPARPDRDRAQPQCPPAGAAGGPADHAQERPARPHAEPGQVPARHPGTRHHLRHRPGRHRQDLPRRRLRRRRLRARPGQPHRADPAGGRGRRAAGFPARRPGAEDRPLPAPALRRALRPDGLRKGRASCSRSRTSKSRRWPTCAGAR